jgi:hypothetical protein
MDCSTFSFDLHVLGAPPALILSRDQTLILSCEMFVVPVEIQSSFLNARRAFALRALTK